jgi:hypothetical protein
MPFPWKFPYVFLKYRRRRVKFADVPNDLIFASAMDGLTFVDIPTSVAMRNLADVKFKNEADGLVFTRSE